MSEAPENPGLKWLILAIATLGLVISNGLAIGGIPVFYKAIQNEFVGAGIVAADRAQSFIANGAEITFLMSGVFSLVGGWLLRIVRIRSLMAFGCACLGAGLVLHSQAGSVWLVYLSRFLMGAALGFVGVAPSVVLVSNWFGRRKGAALGMLLTGTSIGGFVMPIVFAPLIGFLGWRMAMFAVSALVWLVLLPAVVFVIRDPSSAQRPNETKERNDGLTLGEALGTAQFWVFAICAALVFYPIFVTTQQFILYLQSPNIGMSLGIASALQSIIFAVSVGGKSLAGLLSDRFSSGRIIMLGAGLMFASTIILLAAGSPLAFLIAFGLGYGGTFVLLQRLAAEYFGRRDYSRILGTITMIEIVGGVVGGHITAYLADRSGGDYSSAFYMMIFVTAAAFVCTMVLNILNRPPRVVA